MSSGSRESTIGRIGVTFSGFVDMEAMETRLGVRDVSSHQHRAAPNRTEANPTYPVTVRVHELGAYNARIARPAQLALGRSLRRERNGHERGGESGSRT